MVEGASQRLGVFDPLHGIEILLVDDDQDLAELLSYVISRSGASVRAVTSAREALSLLSEWTPDIVLLDVGMPMMDGYELLAEIRRRPRMQDIPAVAVTGQTHSLDRERAFEAGFDVHVAKPVDLTILIDVVEWLSSRRLPDSEVAPPASASRARRGHLDEGERATADAAYPLRWGR